MGIDTNITWRGYVLPKTALSPSDLESLKKDLTVTPYVPKDYQIGTPKNYKLFLESERNLYLPKHYGLHKFGPPILCDVFPGKPLDPDRCTFSGEMREEQRHACDAFLKASQYNVQTAPYGGGGILNLPCGFGKTVIGLHIISRLRVKTLIIVHKDFLLQQWRERISQFLPRASVGMLKASIVDAGDDRDIVIASLQSLSMKDYDVKQLFGSFGLVIVDECHHTSAEVFSNALKKTCFRYTLGLSATLNRKDGLARVFKWFLGPVVYKPPATKSKVHIKKNADGTVDVSTAPVRVQLREFFDTTPAYCAERTMMGGTKLNVSRMINQVCEFEPRNAFIAEQIKVILETEPHRRVLVLSDRRNHLRMIVNALEACEVVKVDCTEDYGFYQGGLDQATLKQSERKKIILGTFQFVSEGFDVPGLDTLVLASPKSDVIQAVGRILRQRPEERRHVPTVIDIIDEFSIFAAQAKKRTAYYSSKKYDVDSPLPARCSPADIAKQFQGACHIVDDDGQA